MENENILLKIIKIKKVIKELKAVKKVKVIKEARNIRDCLIRSFIFYYNNIYQVYKKAKYSANYWL